MKIRIVLQRMHRRSAAILGGIAFASFLFQGAEVRAGSISGSQGFSGGTPVIMAGGSDINSATAIALGTMITNGSQTGDFATYVPSGQVIGSPTITVATPSTFTYSSTGFGSFIGSSIAEDVSGVLPGTMDLYRVIEVVGVLTPGTDFPLGNRDPVTGDFTIMLTQTFPGGAISDGGTVFVANVPEPSSVVLMVLGVLGLSMTRLRRTRRIPAGSPLSSRIA